MTKRHRLFVREYLKDLNGTRAAIAAGYSERSAHVLATRLLKNAKVSEAIEKAFAEREKALDCGLDRLFTELSRIALLDPGKFYDESGNLIPIPELPEDSRRALAGMEIEEAYEHFAKGQAKPTGVVKKIKFWDKGLAIERLLKYKHRIGDKVEIPGLDSLAEVLAEARQRVKG